MRPLTPQGQDIIKALAERHGVSTEALMTMLNALARGNGTMAQFSHPEFGGMVQWTQGGMTMVGDMFNHALKAKVDSLCSELAGLLATEPGLTRPGSHQSQHQSQGRGFGEASLFVSSDSEPWGAWWPEELGTPAATGSQNDIRYACFPATRRLAIEIHGQVTVYDSEDHHISGVSQQQSAGASLTFVSQKGLVRVADLRVVSTPARRDTFDRSGEAPETTPSAAKDIPGDDVTGAASGSPRPVPVPGAAPSTAPSDDIFLKIERLADLFKKGLLSEDEFAAKKAELLSRL
jgi:hypothetical protein